MREIFSALVSLIIVATLSRAATFGCPAENLRIDSAHSAVTCPGWQSVTTAQGIVLPAKAFLVELASGETASDISFTCTDSCLVSTGQCTESHQLLTDADNHYDEVALVEKSFNGSAPMLALGETLLNGVRYANVMIFPVTIDGGRFLAHPTISLAVSSRAISPEDLIPAESVDRSITLRDARLDPATPKYVIITSEKLAPGLEQLRKYKSETGYLAEVQSIENILGLYPGRDQAEQLRNYLKDFYAAGGKYVLLAGDETVLPVRYAYHYSSRSDTGISLDNLQICDLYFADLTGEWDRDNDGIWGERLDDAPDFSAELTVGRLPFSQSEEFAAYTANLIRYETSPGNGDPSYLGRTFFYSSDQMRDLNDGQHNRVAEVFPAAFGVDSVAGVEATRGDDPAPSNLPPAELMPILQDGYGIINILAHGRPDGFVLKSSGYNEWPKTFMLTESETGEHGSLPAMAASGMPSFYVSLACDNAAFDSERLPAASSSISLCQKLLAAPDGAVGFVGYTRWGWVGSSYLLQRALFDSLFAEPDRSAAAALNAMKPAFSYYRDMIYGLNYFGDPTLRVYTSVPEPLDFTANLLGNRAEVRATCHGQPVSGCQVVVSLAGEPVARTVTDQSGMSESYLPSDSILTYTVSVLKSGYITARRYVSSSIATDVDRHNLGLPTAFALSQNYPNPFNPATVIRFELPVRADVRLSIYNSLGQEVRSLENGQFAAGRHLVSWDGLDNCQKPVASGLYFYRLIAGSFDQTKKMVLLR